MLGLLTQHVLPLLVVIDGEKSERGIFGDVLTNVGQSL